jgi:gliding motility-associated-like protein
MNLSFCWAAQILGFVLPYLLEGQNGENILINGSLELGEFECVEGGIDSMRYAPNIGVVRTPDLVCVCDSDANGLWEDEPREVPDGNCYGVFVVNRLSEPWWQGKEAIIGKFIFPLKGNRIYCLEFYYSFLKNVSFYTTNIDVRFEETYFVDNYSTDRDFLPYVPNMTVELEYDTVNWRKGNFKYVARGGERSLVLGFLENPNRVFLPLNNALIAEVRILIDSIAVYDCTEGVEFTLPNVFTPNGDGENEVYRSDQFNVERVEWVVLNRWGQVVHTGKAPVLEWDGRDVFSGEDLAEGVYFVRATAYGNDGSTRTEQQTVHLMR